MWIDQTLFALHRLVAFIVHSFCGNIAFSLKCVWADLKRPEFEHSFNGDKAVCRILYGFSNNTRPPSPVVDPFASVHDAKVEPLCVPVGVHVGPQVQLIVAGCDFDGLGQVARLETRLEHQVLDLGRRIRVDGEQIFGAANAWTTKLGERGRLD